MQRTILLLFLLIFINQLNAQNGEYTRKYKNGNIEESGFLKKGKLHGIFKEYYMNGQLESIGEYKKGEETGIHKNYHENGQLYEVITFVNGEYYGPYEEYLSNGKPSRKGEARPKEGGGWYLFEEYGSWLHYKYHHNGNLEKVITEVDGTKHGEYTSYYISGELNRSGYYKNGNKEGEWYAFIKEDNAKYTLTYQNDEIVNSIRADQYQLFFKNKCTSIISLLLHYKNIDQEWITMGWYNIDPNKEVYLGSTENGIYYYYAENKTGKWEGNKNLTFKGKSYSFRKVDLTNSGYGKNTKSLTCK